MRHEMKTPPAEFRRDMMALAGIICFVIVISTLLALLYPPQRQGRTLAQNPAPTENRYYVPE
jgi:hypothetical protein